MSSRAARRRVRVVRPALAAAMTIALLVAPAAAPAHEFDRAQVVVDAQ
jgi:hypothetical protein